MTDPAARPTYPPPPFRETRREEMLAFLRATAFGHLISAQDGAIHATGVPFLTRIQGADIVLECHLQRGNPQWRGLSGEGLALFQGPHAYVHPGWYETKKADGRAVPTWNYMTVQARGPVQIVDGDDAWLRTHLAALSEGHEAGRPDPWRIDDAPKDYIETLIRAIVGVRLGVRVLEGRWKLSQNHPEANRRGVIDGLTASGSAGAVEIAGIMAARDVERGG